MGTKPHYKFFAKTNIHNKNNNLFKSIVLFNADQLTIDAQSALRRCIEQFSHTTRFFILVNNVNRLLKPILSRFCNIYIPVPIINNRNISLHENFKDHLTNNEFIVKRNKWLKKKLETKKNVMDIQSVRTLTEILYFPKLSVNLKGCKILYCRDVVGKYSLKSLLLTVKMSFPLDKYTLATDVFLLPIVWIVSNV